MIVIKDEKMDEKIKNIQEFAIATIKSNHILSRKFVDMTKKDKEVYQHSLSVGKIAILLGIKYKFNLGELIDIAVGSFIHDIGKLYLNKEILYKPDRLSEDEHIFVEAHTNLGYKLVKDANINQTVLDIIKSHHEKTNGQGYPEGLLGSQIPIYVQLVTIADIFDALISPRVYKKPYTKEEALRVLEKDDGLNVVAVNILADMIDEIEIE